MGLARRKIDGNPERDRLWQQELFPRARLLEEVGRPIPEGLAARPSQSLLCGFTSKSTAGTCGP